MESGNRNTLLMIAIVFIVSMTALVVVLVISWRITGPTIQNIVDGIARFIHLQNLDYNFTVPSVEELQERDIQSFGEVTLAATLTTRAFDYNFMVPEPIVDEAEIRIESAIISDAQQGLAASGEAIVATTTFDIQIPRIGVDSAVYQGQNAEELLKEGFWTYPLSGKLGTGEVVMLCHRRFFGPSDPRSCWNLDQVELGDTISLDLGDISIGYEVYDVRVFDANDPEIYNIDREFDGIRIVTCTPLYSDVQRLVVYGKRN